MADRHETAERLKEIVESWGDDRFTPGTWEESLVVSDDGRRFYEVRDEDEEIIATVWPGDGTGEDEHALEEARADAILIAQAPRLLEFVRDVLEGIGSGGEPSRLGLSLLQLRRKAVELENAAVDHSNGKAATR